MIWYIICFGVGVIVGFFGGLIFAAKNVSDYINWLKQQGRLD